MNNVVYWIKVKSMSDPYTEGYIGVSSNFEKRKKDHINKPNSGNRYLKNCIEKYNKDIEFEILHTCDTIEECLFLENKYRNKERIGWNICVGGGYPPNPKYNEKTKGKISQTIKNMGMIPYCKKTHSKETLKKSMMTKKNNKNRSYYNPETLEYRMFATAKEKPPEGWLPGRKPKIAKEKLVRGIDYICNTKLFNVYRNGILIAENITNLKHWSKQNNLNFKYKGTFKILTKTQRINIININGEIHENGINTKLSQKDYASTIDKSESYISAAVKRGFYINKRYDNYMVIESEKDQSDSAGRG